jgi:hypothetical protein
MLLLKNVVAVVKICTSQLVIDFWVCYVINQSLCRSVTDGQARSGIIVNKVIAEQDVQLRSYQVILIKVLGQETLP